MAHQYDDVFLPFFMHVVSELRQLCKFIHVIGEDLLVLHVVNISVLNILEHKIMLVQLWVLEKSTWNQSFLSLNILSHFEN